MTKIVAILNLTPDSFSDGGKFNKLEEARRHLAQMLNEGADIIDIGAESTRPYALSISADEEWHRLERILPQIIADISDFNRKNHKNILSSIDTRNVETARQAWACGVNIINDVSGLQNEEMIDFIAQNGIKTVFMHSLSVPADPAIIVNRALNVSNEIISWAQLKIKYLLQKNIKKSQLIFDPGIGFSKNGEQSLRIIKNVNAFRVLDLPIYIGHSRKSFLDELHVENLSDDKKSRDEKTVLITQYLGRAGVDFVRVHDVAANKKALQKKENFLKF